MEESSLKPNLKQLVKDCQFLFTNLSEKNRSLSEDWNRVMDRLENQPETASQSDDAASHLSVGDIAGSFSALFRHFSQLFETLVGSLQENEILKKECHSLQSELARFTEQVILLDQAQANLKEQLGAKEAEAARLRSQQAQMDLERTSALAQIMSHEGQLAEFQERFRRLEEDQAYQAQQEAYHIETISRLETQAKELQQALSQAEADKSRAEASLLATEQAHQQSRQHHRELESRIAMLEKALQGLPATGGHEPKAERVVPESRVEKSFESSPEPSLPHEPQEAMETPISDFPDLKDISTELSSDAFPFQDTLSEADLLQFQTGSGQIDSLVLREEELRMDGIENKPIAPEPEAVKTLPFPDDPPSAPDTVESRVEEAPHLPAPQPEEFDSRPVEISDGPTPSIMPPDPPEQLAERREEESPADILDRAFEQDSQDLLEPLSTPRDEKLGLEDLSKPSLPASGILSEPFELPGESETESPPRSEAEAQRPSGLESASDVLSRMFSKLDSGPEDDLDLDEILESLSKPSKPIEAAPSAPAPTPSAGLADPSPATPSGSAMPFPYPEITGEKLDYFHGKRVLLVGGDERFLSDYQHLFGMAKAGLTYFPSLLQLEKKGLKICLSEADAVVVFGRAVNEPGILRLRQSAEEINCPVVEHLSSGLISLYHYLQKVQ